eukprot:TRINITY_DN31715_c0_g1_i1.p1 TRINITY_DN31715_c0_g1~~TRINITY_DN31715_c0_g1_i1.p1  ORF type:complete len:840 (+),score=163.35 TRINITY_DN31715_c0_g1_i1:97-2616(+)
MAGQRRRRSNSLSSSSGASSAAAESLRRAASDVFLQFDPKAGLGALPFTPRTYEGIKDACLRFEDEIESSVKSMRRRLRSPELAYESQQCKEAASFAKATASRPSNSARQPFRGSAQSRLRQKISACREKSIEGIPLIANGIGGAMVNVKALQRGSVGCELQREMGSGPIGAEDIARFLRTREQRAALQRSQSAPNFLLLNTDVRHAKPEARHRASLLRCLERCVRTDSARSKRHEVLEALKQRALNVYMDRFFQPPLVADPSEIAEATRSTCHDAWKDEPTSPLSPKSMRSSCSSSSGTAAGWTKKASAADSSQLLSPTAVTADSLSRLLAARTLTSLLQVFTMEQLGRVFVGEVLQQQAVAFRLLSLLRALRNWVRKWRIHKAADILRSFMQLPMPLCLQVKLAKQLLVLRLKQIQKVWRLFNWRLERNVQRVLDTSWQLQERDILQAVFSSCPLDREFVVGLPDLLCGEANSGTESSYVQDSQTLQMKRRPPSLPRPQVPWRPSATLAPVSAKEKAAADRQQQTAEMQKMINDAFRRNVRQRVRSHCFRPVVAASIVRREMLERLYQYAQLSKVMRPLPGSSPMQKKRAKSSALCYGLVPVVNLDLQDVEQLICAAHRAQGVRPCETGLCEALLPCEGWHVTAAEKMLAGTGWTIREGLLARWKEQRRNSKELKQGLDSSASESTYSSQTSSLQDAAGEEAASRKARMARRRSLSVASTASGGSSCSPAQRRSAPATGPRSRPRSAGPRQPSAAAYAWQASRSRSAGTLPGVAAESSKVKAKKREKAAPAAFVLEDTPSEWPSAALPANGEAGLPFAGALKAPVTWPTLEQVLEQD